MLAKNYLNYFTPIRSSNIFEETIERIVAPIKLRLINPGDPLPPERELAMRLGVSRTTLREALRVLVHAGYLEIRRGRKGGAFVVRWPSLPDEEARRVVIHRIYDRLPSLLDFRRALEPTSAELAALRATPSELDSLRQILSGMKEAEQIFERYRALDALFHITIAQSAKSELIFRSVIEIQSSLTEILDLIIYHSQRALHHSTQYHWRILRAIERRQPERAYRLMRDHIMATENLIRSLIPEINWPPVE
jgi:DNA-binding FadR family transcriptional regulator